MKANDSFYCVGVAEHFIYTGVIFNCNNQNTTRCKANNNSEFNSLA